MKALLKSVLRPLGKAKYFGLLVAFGLVFYLGTRVAGPPVHESSDAEAVMDMTAGEHAGHGAKSPTGGASERRLVMSASNKKLAEIQTTAVERRFADAKVRMVGIVDYDETRVKSISSYVPGRLDRLYVNYTGVKVEKGDHLALIYSPILLSAQEELLEAKRRVDEISAQKSEFLRESDIRALESAREKLRLYGLDEKQIEEIETRGTGVDQILIRAPQSGVVIRKALNEGDYVQTGTVVYTVADLDRVWAKLDAYESDIPWLRYGQQVDLQIEAYPGEHFQGLIAFVDPILDPQSRTVKVRVNIDNADGRLKPGMFVHATVHSRVAKGGKIMDANLAGKWISPMHPEIIKDAPGDCPVCGMPLLKAEDLGYVSAAEHESKPLVVPVSAVLRTGRRAVVYVEVPDAELPTYEGREIVIGSRTGNFYIVQQGLSEGERVVTKGNFNIDSALQIMAMPSMMSMEGESPEEGGDIATLRIALVPIFDAYLDTQARLANDELDGAKKAFAHTVHLVDGVDMTLLQGEAHDAWMNASRQLKRAAQQMGQAPDLDASRAAFDLASTAVIAIEKRFGHTGEQTYVEVFCPMAFERGASWLQTSTDIRNPYLGQSMLDCGEVTSEHAPKKAKAAAGPSGHQH